MIQSESKWGWQGRWPSYQGATQHGSVPGSNPIRNLAMLAVALFATAGSAQELQPSQIDVSELGPQVGELIPEFSLPDQTGEIWTRESIMGPSGAMLVFVRSADW